MAAFCLLAKQGPLFSFCTVTCKLHSRVPTISPKTAGMIGIFLAGFWSLLGVGDTSPPFLHPHTTSLGCGQTYFSDPKPPHPQIPAWTRRLPHAPPMADGMAEPRTVAPATTADLAPSRRTSGRQLPPPLPPPRRSSHLLHFQNASLVGGLKECVPPYLPQGNHLLSLSWSDSGSSDRPVPP